MMCIFERQKEQEQIQNCSLIQDQKSSLLYRVFFFNDANVTKANFLQERSKTQPICEEGLK